MASMPKEWYREQAVRIAAGLLPRRDEAMKTVALEVDEKFADVSCGTNPGGWVMAWIWVPDPADAAAKQTAPETPKVPPPSERHPDPADKGAVEEKAQHGYEEKPPAA